MSSHGHGNYHGHVNYWEQEPEPSDPLPKDAQGKTIIPTRELLTEQLARFRQSVDAARKAEAIEQWAERVWSQR